jgi:hypothetical protein
MVSRAILPASLIVPPDFAPGHQTSDVVLRTVGMERDVRPIEDAQQRHLVVVETLEQAVEHRIVGRYGRAWDQGLVCRP